jgi:hypothetical protein
VSRAHSPRWLVCRTAPSRRSGRPVRPTAAGSSLAFFQPFHVRQVLEPARRALVPDERLPVDERDLECPDPASAWAPTTRKRAPLARRAASKSWKSWFTRASRVSDDGAGGTGPERRSAGTRGSVDRRGPTPRPSGSRPSLAALRGYWTGRGGSGAQPRGRRGARARCGETPLWTALQCRRSTWRIIPPGRAARSTARPAGPRSGRRYNGAAF